jgi:16S rRNA (cytidine1402-2'-O)-methyltransferase
VLVKECIRNGIKVETLPGATAFVPALVNSGLPTDRFCFEGFIPLKKGRHTLLTALSEESRTMIFYESPMRLMRTLQDFIKYFGGDRRCSVSREITKMFEENKAGTLDEVLLHFGQKNVKGEIVLIVEGKA